MERIPKLSYGRVEQKNGKEVIFEVIMIENFFRIDKRRSLRLISTPSWYPLLHNKSSLYFQQPKNLTAQNLNSNHLNHNAVGLK